ncbi:MAG TPA: serine/threonine-protein kinase [Acidimicrobiales bacterium]
MRHHPGELIDRYEVLSSLGEGAYAETYKAKDTTNGSTVVLKMPNPNLFADPGLFQRYRREADIARQLDHPGVQRGVDGGAHRTEPYLVLEYIDGDNLRRLLRSDSGLVPVATAIDWGRQLAEALAYLHRHGVVHRDLKPENVLVTEDGHLKIADFGTAMLEGARRLTWKHLSDSLGTPDYMSPEQCQGERGDARSDIYAWGVMMYEILTGRVPFRGDNWLAVMAGHLGENPTPIHKLRSDVPPGLEAVVMHAMRRSPANRYQSAEELVADLDDLDHVDPAMYPMTPEPPMGGMAAINSERRLWAIVALIAVSFIGVVAVIITLSVVLR